MVVANLLASGFMHRTQGFVFLFFFSLCPIYPNYVHHTGNCPVLAVTKVIFALIENWGFKIVYLGNDVDEGLIFVGLAARGQYRYQFF